MQRLLGKYAIPLNLEDARENVSESGSIFTRLNGFYSEINAKQSRPSSI